MNDEKWNQAVQVQYNVLTATFTVFAAILGTFSFLNQFKAQAEIILFFIGIVLLLIQIILILILSNLEREIAFKLWQDKDNVDAKCLSKIEKPLRYTALALAFLIVLDLFIIFILKVI